MPTSFRRGTFASAALSLLVLLAVTAPGVPGGELAAQTTTERFAPVVISSPDSLRGFGDLLDARDPHRDDVPRPAEHLGYAIGSLHTPHARMLDYMRTLEQAAPGRVRLETYGESYEKKRLVLAFIGSESNLDRLEEIRRATNRLADPRSTSEQEAAELVGGMPIIVWLNYANDGDETAALEAAMEVAWELAAGESEETRRFRENALVILNPDHNPESHDRQVSWYNAFGIGAADPGAMEHDAPWGMGTNNNHYQIDLNRDGWGITQKETQAIAAQVLRWKPQVFVDHHGQTEQYFFPPPVDPVNPHLPDSHMRWYQAFGAGNAAAFDRMGWSYYVRDVFDLFYPGYWDSWPALHGAIGMTYETDGGGSKGLRWERRDGSIATFREAIDKHVTASLATIRTAVENRAAILEDFAAFFRSAMERGREAEESARAFALVPEPDPRRAASLVATLLRHGIEVTRAEESFRGRGRHHQTGETEVRTFPEGTWVIDAAQPQGRAAVNFLAADVPLDSAFVERQIAKWTRNARRGEDAPKEGFEFYDVTAWSLPLAYGVDAYELSELPSGEREIVRPDAGALVGSGDWTEEIPFAVPGLRGGVRAGADRARSAYLFRPESEGALRLLAGLLGEEFRVAVATRPLMVGERSFPRGTFVVRTTRNPDALHERIDALARDAGVPVDAAGTAFPARGQVGTGSGAVRSLHPPRVGIAADEGVSTNSYGHAWFTLERRLEYPFTPLRLRRLIRNLDDFDVIVLPDGSPGAYGAALGEDGAEELGSWIERGGTLVAWSGGAEFAVLNDLVGAELVRDEVTGEGAIDTLTVAQRLARIEALPRAAEPLPPAVSPTAEPNALQPVPGAVLRAELDRTHWLTLGFPDPDLAVPAMGDSFLTLSPSGASPVVFSSAGGLRLSGFVWPGNTERLLAGTAHAVVEESGRGQVILFAADPLYRLVWRGTSRLFANAVLLGPSLGASGVGR